jgi:alkylation response protein AidB-like acyl-CoA dehydrogenase
MSRPMPYHAEVQHSIAEMVIELETAEALLDRAAGDWADNTDREEVG